MRRGFLLKAFSATLALASVGALSAHAQDSVPGGWDSHFGYQSLSGPDASVGPTSGYGSSSFASSYSAFGYGQLPYGNGAGMVASIPNVARPNYAGSAYFGTGPQTYDGTSSLINTIRQTTRSSRRR
ncbi:hypothetical protein [Singulisphaera sp. PoT]|uniref:hypothetical protein n=1 Tax=Singulisphaera sp. PoT TaxID=3411797 RepID=UPI003BF5798C